MQRQKDTFKGSKLLKPTNVNIEYTEEQILELLKCKKDPLYFIENYMKIVTLDEGVVPFKMYDFQKEMIETFHNNRFSICKLSRQVGKCIGTNSLIKLRNKKTGDILEVPIGEFYESIKQPENKLPKKAQM